MHGFVDAILVVLVLTDLLLLGSFRLGASVRTSALQGVALGVLPLFAHHHGLGADAVLLALVATGAKGVLFPWLMLRAVRIAQIPRAMKPIVGTAASVVIGMVLLVLCREIAPRLPLPYSTGSTLVLPVALFTIFCGLFLLVARRLALTQVLGYLVMENGVFAFGVAGLPPGSFTIELLVLLDLLVAVFVMGVTVSHISRTFNSIDTRQLTELKG